MAMTLRSVISELQYILQLSTENPGDARLPKLLDDAKKDLATVAKGITGDDPIINT